MTLVPSHGNVRTYIKLHIPGMIRSAVGNSCRQCRHFRPDVVSPASYLSQLPHYQGRWIAYEVHTNQYVPRRTTSTYLKSGDAIHHRPRSNIRTALTAEFHNEYFPQRNFHRTAVKRQRPWYCVSSSTGISIRNHWGNELSQANFRSASCILLSSRPHQQNTFIRWNSSSNNDKEDKSETAPDKNSTTPHKASTDTVQSAKSTKSNSITSSSDTASESVASSAESSSHTTNHPSSGKGVSDAVVAATQELEQRIKRVVRGEHLTIGDQLSVALIAIFTAILLTAPYAVRHMKQQANTVHGYEDRLQTDDPVDEFVKLARREWNIVGGNVDDDETNNGSEEKNEKFIEVVLKDVLQSKTVQHAAQEFVVQIIQSERFQSTIQHFVKELWNDLVTDPETVAQVIKLLEVAITSTPIKNAVVELVLQIAVRETEFRDAMVQMIQNLGMDDDVRNAVVHLLTEATHTTLNDPEILDHSMEFATDVVGDDIVQQTAGEALRKSVEHAVKPATTIILSAAGVGLLIFSFIALGYSRSSESEARVFASAARSLHSNAAIGMSRILNWPFRTFPNMVMRSINTVSRHLSTPLHQMASSLRDALSSVAMNIISVTWKGLQTAGRWLSTKSSTLIYNISASIYKHSMATMKSMGIWMGTSAVAIAAVMERGIRTMSFNFWTYTLQGFKYVGHNCWSMTLYISTYVGKKISNLFTLIYNSMTSYDEW